MDVCHLYRKPGNSAQGRIQVEAPFIPVECFWKKVRPSRVITFVLLLLVSLFNHQFVPNLYQCHAIHEKTAMPMTGRFHIIREPPAYSSNLLYGSPNLPEHINHNLRLLLWWRGRCVWCWVCMLQKRQSPEIKSPEVGNFLRERSLFEAG